MNRKLTSIICFSLLTFTSINQSNAMGSKDAPANAKTEIAESTGSKVQLADKFLEVSKLLTFPDIRKFLAPLEEEFKGLDMPAKPFDKTLAKANEYLMQFIQPVMNVIKKPMIAEAAKHFTEAELKELIEIYQKPVMQKQYDFMLTWILGPLFSALKDPAVLAQYTQEIIGLGMGFALQQNPKEWIKKGQELTKLVEEELTALQLTVKFDSPEFKEKLKNRYKSVSAIIDTLNLSKLSTDVQGLSKGIESMLQGKQSTGMPQGVPMEMPQGMPQVIPQAMPLGEEIPENSASVPVSFVESESSSE
ncbi:MAG: hypothetical protein Q8S31_03500 [Alphaproteobacteria bacterium]|nr:hypothetical protein [Alphaproteobacteria bacterium]